MKIGRNEICRKYNISTQTLSSWKSKYEKNGLKELKPNTEKLKGSNKCIWLKKLSCERRWSSKGVHHYIRQEYKIIDKLKSQYSIVNLCEEVSVSKSGYYKWRHRKENTSKRELSKQADIKLNKEIHDKHPHWL